MAALQVMSVAITLVTIMPALAVAQPARSCSEAVSKCQMEGAGKPNIDARCAAAGQKCQQTGVFVGPVTGRRWTIKNR